MLPNIIKFYIKIDNFTLELIILCNFTQELLPKILPKNHEVPFKFIMGDAKNVYNVSIDYSYMY